MNRSLLFISAVAAGLLCSCSNGAMAPQLRAGTDPTAPSSSSAATASNSQSSAQPQVVQSSQKLHYRLGPISLPAQSAAELMQEQPKELHIALDESLWLTGFSVTLENEQGERLPGNLLHSAQVVSNGSTSHGCSAAQSSAPIFAATSAQTRIQLPNGYGYAALPTDQIRAQILLQNLASTSYQNVYIDITLEAVSMRAAAAIRDVEPVLLSDTPCHLDMIAIEPGAYVRHEVRAPAPVGGHIVAAQALVQQHSVGITLRRDTEGAANFWDESTELNSQRHVTQVRAYQHNEGELVSLGESLLLTVSYQNFSQNWLNHATAGALVYIAPSNNTGGHGAAKPFRNRQAAKAATVQSMLLQ